MHAEERAPSFSGRAMGQWFLLTLATAGFAVTLAGLTSAPGAYVGYGMAITAFAGLLFLINQFYGSVTGGTQVADRQSAKRPTAPRVAAARQKTKPPAAAGYDLPPPDAVPDGPGVDQVDKEPAFSIKRPRRPVAKKPRAEGAWPEATERLWRQRQGQGPQVRADGDFELPPAFRDGAMLKRKKFLQEMPIVQHILDEAPGPTATRRDGKTRGKCGGCGTYLWAPPERPIRLRCPKCGKIALLAAK